MCDYVKGTPSFSVVDSNYLHEPFTKDMLSHDPYTPESIESHSPLPDEKKNDEVPLKKQSVSPRILKSRLENILRTEKEKDHKKVCYTQSDRVLDYKNVDQRVEKNVKHKELGYTQSDSKFLGYVRKEHKKLYSSENIKETTEEDKPKHHHEHTKLCYTYSDVPHMALKKYDVKFLSKSHSQHLDTKHLEEHPCFRARCMTDISRKVSRARLISVESAQSIHRLQSHHSSSDEDWFEFEEVDVESDTFKDPEMENIDEVSNEVILDGTAEEEIKKDSKKLKRKQKIDACCTVS